MAEKARLPSVTERMDDESDAERFQFVFYCDCCGQGYRTPPIPFSAANAPKDCKDFTKAQRLIWDTEHEDAYERGNRSALITFRPCKICGRHICEDCGGAEPDDHICPGCRAKTKEGRADG